MAKIFIDPGHGGTDPGAVANGIQEKNITLQIATGIRDILLSEYDNVSVLMSRTGDQTVSLDERTDAANNWGADFFISVHINSGGSSGFESYIHPDVGRPTLTYQEIIHQKILEQVDFSNRGMKRSDFHVLRESNMDAILTENGFIDHAGDAGKLKNNSFINSLAKGHALGVADSFQLTRKAGIPNPHPTLTSPSSNGLFKVQIGAFRDKNNADQVAGKAKESGFEVYTKYENSLYKVQLGAFKERKNAEDLVNRAKTAGFNPVIQID
jgi:N-acetylmuramoyl-L-alanine amidase